MYTTNPETGPAPLPPVLVAVYTRHRPEETTLYNVVRENLDTLYDAVDECALAIALPKFVRKELEGYLECGLLCRVFAAQMRRLPRDTACGVQLPRPWNLPVLPRPKDVRDGGKSRGMRSSS